MKHLIKKVEELKKSEIRKVIDQRVCEFEGIDKSSAKQLFNELCFCILTANFNAERTIKIQKELKDGFYNLSPDSLAAKLKELGHRFPNTRAKYIVEARQHRDKLPGLLKDIKDDKELRKWFADNVKGLGYKESSHYLRNIGRSGCAIIDFHIVDILASYALVKPCDSLSKKKYLEVENVLGILAEKLGLSQGELDLYLWYLETGKVLK